MKDSYDDIFSNKSRIMFVFAHPDDSETYCGGTIARLVSDRKSVRLIKMTKGNKGSRDQIVSEEELIKIRESEDKNALNSLGVNETDSVNLDLGDGEVENNLNTIGKLVAEIRQFRPELIVTHNPEQTLIRDLEGNYYVNHRDHRNTASITIDAAYPYSRDLLFYPEQLKAGLQGHTTSEFLIVDSWGHPDTVYIDVTDQFEQRTKAIASHKSQYSQHQSEVSSDYFAPKIEDKRFEQFRYIVAD